MGGGQFTSTLHVKENGIFFSAYNEDAWILSYIFDYKLVDGIKVGFPENVIEKIKNKLEEYKISYIIEYNDGRLEKKDFHKLNRYEEFLNDSKDIIDNKIKIDLIVKRIKNLSYTELLEVIEVLDEHLK